MHNDDNPLVYSTDSGRIQEAKPQPVVDKGDGIVRLRRETKGRKGKGVTLVTGLGMTADELKTLHHAQKAMWHRGCS